MKQNTNEYFEKTLPLDNLSEEGANELRKRDSNYPALDLKKLCVERPDLSVADVLDSPSHMDSLQEQRLNMLSQCASLVEGSVVKRGREPDDVNDVRNKRVRKSNGTEEIGVDSSRGCTMKRVLQIEDNSDSGMCALLTMAIVYAKNVISQLSRRKHYEMDCEAISVEILH